jgi:SanA protein
MLWRLTISLARAAVAGAVLLGVLAVPRWVLGRRYARVIYAPQSVPPQPVAIVFGAGLRRDGTPTTVLADRVETAVRLYQQGSASRLLMSGSPVAGRSSEAEAMASLALRLGVPREALLLDQGGSRTYDTCERARRLFGLDRAILVTQRFHLPRALATCEALGIQAVGVAAEIHSYSLHSLGFWWLREVPATLVALWETSRLHAQAPSCQTTDRHGGAEEPWFHGS